MSHRKGIDMTKTISCTNYVKLTNRIDQKIIEDGTRRFVMFKVCPERRSRRFFEEYDSLLKNEEAASAVMWSLLNDVDLSEFDPQRWPEDETHKQVQNANRNSALRYVDECRFGCLNCDDEWVEYGLMDRESGAVKIDELFAYYLVWCQFGQFKPDGLETFKKVLSQY